MLDVVSFRVMSCVTSFPLPFLAWQRPRNVLLLKLLKHLAIDLASF